MKISFLLTTIDSAAGTERAIITQANSLVSAGHDVQIYSVYRTTGSPAFPLDPKVRVTYWVDKNTLEDLSGTSKSGDSANYGVKPSRLIPVIWDDQFSLLTDRISSRALPSIKCDIMVTTTPALGLLAGDYLAPEIVVIAQEHRATMRRGKGFIPLALASQHIDCIVSLTEASTEWIAGELENSGVRLETIPNVLPDMFRPQSTTQEKTVIAAGRLAPGKQFGQLIDAFSRVHDEHPDWKLRIYGEGPLEENLKNQVVRLDLTDVVEIVPPVKKLELEWPKGSILALTSRMEGLPLVIMEAAGAGVPTISYDCLTGPAELINDGKSGILVPLNNVASMAHALSKLMSNDKLRLEMGQAAKREIRQYSPTKISAEWHNLYSELHSEAQLTPVRDERNAARFAALLDYKELETISETAEVQNSSHESNVSSIFSIVPAAELDYKVVLEKNRILVHDILVKMEAKVKQLNGYHQNREILAIPTDFRDSFLAQIAQFSDESIVVEPFIGSTSIAAKRWHPALQPMPMNIAEANLLRIYGRFSDVQELAQVGAEAAVDVEFWERDEETGWYSAPRHNRLYDTLEESDFKRAGDLDNRLEEAWSLVNFPIDVVYTWVDGNDRAWQTKKSRFAPEEEYSHQEAVSEARFTNRDELRYSIRSLRRYAPWVRNVYVVTDDQRPEWLSKESDIKVVSHRELFPDSECLPTFNSHAIETTLHRIPGLAEHFLYCNDDTVMLRQQSPETYFTPNGLAKFFPSPIKINNVGEQNEPHIVAAKNNRQIISERFGMTISQSMLHTLHPHRKSVLAQIEEEQSGAVMATRRHKFRDPDDVSFLSSLGQYYGFGLEKYVPGSIRYTYLGLGRPETETRLVKLLNSRNFDIVTFGESNDGYENPEETNRQLRQFFETKFPLRTSDEVSENE